MKVLFFIFTISLSLQSYVFAQIQTDDLFNIPKPKQKDFDISMEIESLGSQEHRLIIDIELQNEAYIISPFSTDSFYLNFTVQFFDDNKSIEKKELKEFPAAMEEYDPLIEKRVMFVRADTRYQQVFKLDSKEDIQVRGLIEFLVEPSCIPYDILFTLSQKDGILTLADVETKISKEYKL